MFPIRLLLPVAFLCCLILATCSLVSGGYIPLGGSFCYTGTGEPPAGYLIPSSSSLSSYAYAPQDWRYSASGISGCTLAFGGAGGGRIGRIQIRSPVLRRVTISITNVIFDNTTVGLGPLYFMGALDECTIIIRNCTFKQRPDEQVLAYFANAAISGSSIFFTDCTVDRPWGPDKDSETGYFGIYMLSQMSGDSMLAITRTHFHVEAFFAAALTVLSSARLSDTTVYVAWSTFTAQADSTNFFDIRPPDMQGVSISFHDNAVNLTVAQAPDQQRAVFKCAPIQGGGVLFVQNNNISMTVASPATVIIAFGARSLTGLSDVVITGNTVNFRITAASTRTDSGATSGATAFFLQELHHITGEVRVANNLVSTERLFVNVVMLHYLTNSTFTVENCIAQVTIDDCYDNSGIVHTGTQTTGASRIVIRNVSLDAHVTVDADQSCLFNSIILSRIDASLLVVSGVNITVSMSAPNSTSGKVTATAVAISGLAVNATTQPQLVLEDIHVAVKSVNAPVRAIAIDVWEHDVELAGVDFVVSRSSASYAVSYTLFSDAAPWPSAAVVQFGSKALVVNLILSVQHAVTMRSLLLRNVSATATGMMPAGFVACETAALRLVSLDDDVTSFVVLGAIRFEDAHVFLQLAAQPGAEASKYPAEMVAAKSDVFPQVVCRVFQGNAVSFRARSIEARDSTAVLHFTNVSSPPLVVGERLMVQLFAAIAVVDARLPLAAAGSAEDKSGPLPVTITNCSAQIVGGSGGAGSVNIPLPHTAGAHIFVLSPPRLPTVSPQRVAAVVQSSGASLHRVYATFEATGAIVIAQLLTTSSVVSNCRVLASDVVSQTLSLHVVEADVLPGGSSEKPSVLVRDSEIVVSASIGLHAELVMFQSQSSAQNILPAALAGNVGDRPASIVVDNCTIRFSDSAPPVPLFDAVFKSGGNGTYSRAAALAYCNQIFYCSLNAMMAYVFNGLLRRADNYGVDISVSSSSILVDASASSTMPAIFNDLPTLAVPLLANVIVIQHIELTSLRASATDSTVRLRATRDLALLGGSAIALAALSCSPREENAAAQRCSVAARRNHIDVAEIVSVAVAAVNLRSVDGASGFSFDVDSNHLALSSILAPRARTLSCFAACLSSANYLPSAPCEFRIFNNSLGVDVAQGAHFATIFTRFAVVAVPAAGSGGASSSSSVSSTASLLITSNSLSVDLSRAASMVASEMFFVAILSLFNVISVSPFPGAFSISDNKLFVVSVSPSSTQQQQQQHVACSRQSLLINGTLPRVAVVAAVGYTASRTSIVAERNAVHVESGAVASVDVARSSSCGDMTLARNNVTATDRVWIRDGAALFSAFPGDVLMYAFASSRAGVVNRSVFEFLPCYSAAPPVIKVSNNSVLVAAAAFVSSSFSATACTPSVVLLRFGPEAALALDMRVNGNSVVVARGSGTSGDSTKSSVVSSFSSSFQPARTWFDISGNTLRLPEDDGNDDSNFHFFSDQQQLALLSNALNRGTWRIGCNDWPTPGIEAEREFYRHNVRSAARLDILCSVSRTFGTFSLEESGSTTVSQTPPSPSRSSSHEPTVSARTASASPRESPSATERITPSKSANTASHSLSAEMRLPVPAPGSDSLQRTLRGALAFATIAVIPFAAAAVVPGGAFALAFKSARIGDLAACADRVAAESDMGPTIAASRPHVGPAGMDVNPFAATVADGQLATWRGALLAAVLVTAGAVVVHGFVALFFAVSRSDFKTFGAAAAHVRFPSLTEGNVAGVFAPLCAVAATTVVSVSLRERRDYFLDGRLFDSAEHVAANFALVAVAVLLLVVLPMLRFAWIARRAASNVELRKVKVEHVGASRDDDVSASPAVVPIAPEQREQQQQPDEEDEIASEQHEEDEEERVESSQQNSDDDDVAPHPTPPPPPPQEVALDQTPSHVLLWRYLFSPQQHWEAKRIPQSAEQQQQQQQQQGRRRSRKQQQKQARLLQERKQFLARHGVYFDAFDRVSVAAVHLGVTIVIGALSSISCGTVECCTISGVAVALVALLHLALLTFLRPLLLRWELSFECAASAIIVACAVITLLILLLGAKELLSILDVLVLVSLVFAMLQLLVTVLNVIAPLIAPFLRRGAARAERLSGGGADDGDAVPEQEQELLSLNHLLVGVDGNDDADAAAPSPASSSRRRGVRHRVLRSYTRGSPAPRRTAVNDLFARVPMQLEVSPTAYSTPSVSDHDDEDHDVEEFAGEELSPQEMERLLGVTYTRN